jgi:sigma-B regulation protein RsbU (phosphoserine phosphatase)
MTFERRLVLLVTGLLVLAVLATAAALGWGTWRALVVEARDDGQRVATRLARSAVLAGEISGAVEEVAGEGMVSQAVLTAHLVAVAEAAKTSAKTINERLKTVVENTAIGELWITDSRGRAYLHSSTGPDAVFPADPRTQTQGNAFADLLRRDNGVVIQEARRRDGDERVMKYVGVSGVDKARIVQVGMDVAHLKEVTRYFGLERMIEMAAAGGGIDAGWVLSGEMAVLGEGTGVAGRRAGPPSPDEVDEARAALAEGKPRASVVDGFVVAAAPVMVTPSRAVGVALVRLPAPSMLAALRIQALLAGSIAAAVLALGLWGVAGVARRQKLAVAAMAEAMESVQVDRYNPFILNDLCDCDDELGRLARLFRTMAGIVMARQERLEVTVQARARDLEQAGGQAEAARQSLGDALVVARTLQRAMQPDELPADDTLAVAGRLVPGRQLGGDFYDIFALHGGRVVLVVGCAGGQGAAAVGVMVLAREAIRRAARLPGGASPSAVLDTANAALCAGNPLGLPVDLVCAIYDRASGEVRVAVAGDGCLLLLAGPDGEVRSLGADHGVALGLHADAAYGEERVMSGPGDSLFLGTAGILEARSPAGQAFGGERLTAALAGGEVADAVAAFTGAVEPKRGYACLTLRRPRAEDSARDPAHA